MRARLAIDAGTGGGASAAVLDADVGAEGRVLGHAAGVGRADALVPLIEAALKEAGLKAADLDAVAVAVGPGGFTGVRVAVAAAKGLCLALGVGAYPVGSLAALAEAARAPARGRAFVAVLPAGRGEVYAQAFGADGDPAGGTKAQPLILALAPAAVEGAFAPLGLVVGPAADTVAAALAGRVEALTLAHDARHVGLVALDMAAQDGGAPVSGFDLAPVYLRPADAKPAAGRPLVGPGAA